MTHRPHVDRADLAMVAWAAYRGTVELDDGKRVTLVNWARRGPTARIRVGNRHYTLPKTRIARPFGFVVINGTTCQAGAVTWPTPTMLEPDGSQLEPTPPPPAA